MSDSSSAAPGAGTTRARFLAGVRDIAPVMIATVPFGLIFGAVAVQEGLSAGEALFMSSAVYAGASQFVALEFWTDPLPVWTILLSVLAVNLRHVLYGAALGRKMTHWPAWQRYVGFGLMVDPTFAMADLRGGPRLSAAYYFGLCLPLYANWFFSTLAGSIFGALLGGAERIPMDFVVIAYFIFLIVGFRKRSNASLVVLASAAGSVLAHLAYGSPWHFAGGAFAGMVLAASLAAPRQTTA